MKKSISILVFIAFAFPIGYAQKVVQWKVKKLEKFISQPQEKILIVNFWATYCTPCLEEIPGLLRVMDSMKSVATLKFVSIDPKDSFPTAIKNYAHKQNIRSTMIWMNEKLTTYFFPKIHPDWHGAIPSTLFINFTTGYRKLVEGKMSEKEFLGEIEKTK